MRAPLAATAAAIAATGCYHGAAASRDIDDAWRGRTRAELEARWGAPAATDQTGGPLLLRFTHTHREIELPSAGGALTVEPGHVAGWAEIRAGAVWTSTTDAVATVDDAGRIAGMQGASVEWGPPDDANLHWGAIFGLHVGLGRLDDTSTPLPSGGLYIGGMLGPRLGLVGTYALASGSASGGGAMGMAAGVGAQWWPATRIALRAGPAAVLSWRPGFSDARFTAGVDASASFAAVKVGTFVLDLRADLVAAPGTAFGSLGVGVNRN